MVSFMPQPLYPLGKEPPLKYWKGGWVGPRSGLDDVEKRKFNINTTFSYLVDFHGTSQSV
jgi:hypothetical protein